MSTGGSAARYARALFDVALQESIAERAETDLAAFAELMASHDSLQRVLTHPALPAARKRRLTEALTARLGLTTPVTKVLLLMADRDRLALVPDLLAIYRERLLDHQQVVRAEVTTAETLSADGEAQLRDRLARITGRQVTLTTKVDPDIVGGLIARIGSTVYDGSLSAQLAKMRARLARTS